MRFARALLEFDLCHAVLAILLWGLLASLATGQDGVLNKQTIELSEEKFGGIEEVAVVHSDGAIEAVALDPPVGVTEALSEAGRQLGENLEGDIGVLCFGTKRIELDRRTEREISETPGTVFIGDPDNAPCEVNVLTGQLNIITTITETSTHFYSLLVHLDADRSCALGVTLFAYDDSENEVTLVWESIPEAKYTIEWSRDLRDWQALERDVPSHGSSTTHTLKLNESPKGSGYFRVRLQLASLPTP